MYDSRSKKAEEFIDDNEIKRTLEYAEKHRGDIELLEAAGTGYAMDDCAPGVEKYADCQTASVESVLRTLV